MPRGPLYRILEIAETKLSLDGPRHSVIRDQEILGDPTHHCWGQIRGDLVFDYFLLGDFAYLRDCSDTTLSAFREVVRYAKEHFFGSWRGTYATEKSGGDPDYWRERACISRFSEAILACAVLGDWTSAKVLAMYPDDRCRYADYKGSDEEWDLAMALADWLRHDELTGWGRGHLQKALSGKAARPREEAKLLEAAAQGDSDRVRSLFPTYMKFYKTRVFPKSDLTDKQSKAGTFWYHWYAKEGIDLDSEGKWSNYLIRLSVHHTT